MFSPELFLDLSRTRQPELFEGLTEVWRVLPRISGWLEEHLAPGMHGAVMGSPFVSDEVYVGEGTVIEHGAVVKGPAWIGSNCRIRSGAYIRENVIVGDGVMLGNSSEFKNCILFDQAEVPHFNYVGDSVLGFKAHLGAGVILSNVRLDRGFVSVRMEGSRWETGLKKFGAVVGDRTEIGCHSVLSPGSVLGRDCILYPGTQWRGVLPSSSMVSWTQAHSIITRRV